MSTGTRRGLLSFAGVLAMVLALIAPQAAVAQAGGSKALITGETVAWTAEWTHDPEIGGGDAQFELLVLSRGGSLVAVGGTSFAASSTEVRDLVIEGFASDGTLRQIDRGDYDNVSYSIDISTTDNVSIALFTLVIENPNATSIYVLISDPPAFQGAMESAQAAVTVNGLPIFDGVDAAVMQQTINVAVPAASAAVPTTPAPPAPPAITPAPAPPVATTPAAQPTAGGGDTSGGLNTGLGAATGQPTSPAQGATPPAATMPPSGAPLPNAVAVASSGAEVRFSNAWAVQSEADASVSIETQGPPPVLMTVIDLGPLPGQVEAPVLADALIARIPDLADAQLQTAVNTPDGRIVIVMLDPSPNGTLYRVYEVQMDAVATTAITVIVEEAGLAQGIDLVSGTVTVNGQPVLSDLRQFAPELFPAS